MPADLSLRPNWLATAEPSLPPPTLAPMQDYAGAWSADRGRCHRFVYTSNDDGRPMNCPEPVVGSGWRLEEFTGEWHLVDSCEQHLSELLERPRPKRRP